MTERTATLSRLSISVMLLVAICSPAMAAYPVVGNPANPGGLSAAILAAYNSGNAGVTIAPGTYVLPISSTSANWYFNFQNLKNFEIDAYGVTLEIADNSAYGGFYFNNCQNVIFAGATAYPQIPTFSQGAITSGGTDSGGPYLLVQIDTGYPTDFTNVNHWLFTSTDVANCDVYDKTTRRFKTNSPDFAITSATSLGGNLFKFYVNSSLVLPGTGVSQVGDYISLLGKFAPAFALGNGTVTLKDLTLPWGASGMDESGGGPDQLINVLGTYQSSPPGAIDTAIVGGLGINSILTRTGPTLTNCSFAGTIDDMINCHGGLDQVGAVNGSTMTVGSPWATELVAGDVIRIYDKAGDLIDHATVEATPTATTFTQPTKSIWPIFQNYMNYYTVSLDHAVAAQYDYFLNDMNATGSGLTITGCTFRNDRDVPILVKCDNVKIENSTIDGGTVAAITLGPSLYWGEGGFGHHVAIKNNLIENNGYVNALYTVQAAALNMAFENTGGPTATGVDNSDVLIENNTFDNNAAMNINVSNASNVRIVGNTLRNTHQQNLTPGSGLGVDAGAEIWVAQSAGVALAGNILENPGPYETHVVEEGAGVLGLSGGSTGVISSGTQVNLVNRSNDTVFDVAGTKSNQYLIEDLLTGAPNQKWTVTADPSGEGKFTLQNGTQLSYLGNNGVTSAASKLFVFSSAPSSESLWNLAWSENGYGVPINALSSLGIDSHSAKALSGATLKQYPLTSAYSQEWNIQPVDGAAATYRFDENAGTTSADGTGNGHVATLQGATWTAGAFGSAVALNGTNQYVDTGASLINTSQSFTVSAWVKLNAFTGSQTFIGQDGTNISPFYLNVQPSGLFDITICSTDADYAPDVTAWALQPAATGQWYQVTGVYNGTAQTLSLYVDGVLQNTVAATTPPFNAAGHTEIGRAKYFGNPTDFINGAIDHVRIYQTALTASAVANLYTPIDNALDNYKFDEGTGTTTVDATDNASAATLIGTPTWTQGIGNTALTFSGVAQNVDTGSKRLATNQSFTVSAWVNVNALGTSQTFVSQDGKNISPFFLNINPAGYFDFTTYPADVNNSTDYAALSLQPALPKQWYHVVGTYNAAAAQISLYVNGVLQSTISAPSAPFSATGHTEIGRAKYFGAPTDYVNGTIDNVRIYQRALSSAEAINLYGELE